MTTLAVTHHAVNALFSPVNPTDDVRVTEMHYSGSNLCESHASEVSALALLLHVPTDLYIL